MQQVDNVRLCFRLAVSCSTAPRAGHATSGQREVVLKLVRVCQLNDDATDGSYD